MRAERSGALDRALEFYRAAERAAIASGDADARAEARTREADALRARCDWDAALAAARDAQHIARPERLFVRLAEAVIAEANVLMCRGDFASAMPKFCEIVTTSSEPRLRAIALQNIGSMHAQTGQFRAAEQSFQESLECFRADGYARGEGIALNNLGRLAIDAGDFQRARPVLERAIQVARAVEDHDLAALASLNLSWALCGEGDHERAHDLAMVALGYYAEEQNHWREIECLRLVGQINERCRDAVNARRCYEMALSLAERIGSEPEATESRNRLAALASAGRTEEAGGKGGEGGERGAGGTGT